MDAKQMYKMCLKKRKYKSQDLANKVAEECTIKYGKPHRVYYCPLCGYYHLTTKPPKSG